MGRYHDALKPQGGKVRRLSKSYYLTWLVVGTLSFGGFYLADELTGAETDINPGIGFVVFAMGLVALTMFVVGLLFWYRAWASIPHEFARTTPLKAIVYMFIPIFEIYWQFQLVWGFAKDYEILVITRRITPWTPDEKLFVALPALYVASGIASWIPRVGEHISVALVISAMVVTAFVISQVCDAVNILADYYETDHQQNL